MRSQLNEALPPGSEALTKRFEQDLDLQLETAVNAVVRLVDEKGQDVPREERVERLVDEARAVYHGMILTIVDDVHRDYSAQVRGLNRELRRLRKGRWLSANEQIHKEIIEATLVLIERHKLKDAITPQTISDMGLAP